jgi:hypothetical protein
MTPIYLRRVIMILALIVPCSITSAGDSAALQTWTGASPYGLLRVELWRSANGSAVELVIKTVGTTKTHLGALIRPPMSVLADKNTSFIMVEDVNVAMERHRSPPRLVAEIGTDGALKLWAFGPMDISDPVKLKANNQ